MENLQICCLCSKEAGKYTCPRCNILYCSKACYQSPDHINCSEQFYQECIENELKLEYLDGDQKNTMMEILNKFRNSPVETNVYNNEDSDDEDSIVDLSERLQNIDLDDVDAVWTCMTKQEKEEFQAIFESGDISSLISAYEPWWYKSYDKKIEELEDSNTLNSEEEYTKICPPVPEIVTFCSLSKVPPSPCVMWNITNVLAAYSLVSKCYLGDHYNSIAATHFLNVCKNLNCNQNFENMTSAVESVKEEACKNEEISNSQQLGELLLDDVSKLLLGPKKNAPAYYILAALADLQSVFNQCLVTQKKKTKQNGPLKQHIPQVALDKNKLHSVIHKLTFYMSWCNDFYKYIPN